MRRTRPFSPPPPFSPFRWPPPSRRSTTLSRRDRYSTGPGRYPDSGHVDRVAALAHEIEQTARYICREAARNNRRPDRDEARCSSDL